MRKQLALLAGRAGVPVEWLTGSSASSSNAGEDTEMAVEGENEEGEELDETLQDCLGNLHLSTHFRNFGKELGVSEPKGLEDVYKSHLEGGRELFLV